MGQVHILKYLLHFWNRYAILGIKYADLPHTIDFLNPNQLHGQMVEITFWVPQKVI